MNDGEHERTKRCDLFAGALVLAALLACGATEDQLRTRSAFDLNCPAEQLSITFIDGMTRGVTGCGQRVTYVQVCDGPPSLGRSCTWVLNTEGRPAVSQDRAAGAHPQQVAPHRPPVAPQAQPVAPHRPRAAPATQPAAPATQPAAPAHPAPTSSALGF